MKNIVRVLHPANQTFTLQRLDNKDLPDAKREIRAFLCIRNESDLLPFLLSYYRDLGVDRFFVIDDHSTDGTRAYLSTQPDIHIFTASNTFKASKSGIDWSNLLLDTYGTGHWTLTIDADELLVYPHCETVKLAELCNHLDRQGHTALSVFLLDMYPGGDLSRAIYLPDQPFPDICPFFDSHYAFRRRRQTLPDGVKSLPAEHVVGGPRMRKFYPRQRRTDPLSRAALKLIIRLADKIPFWRGDKPHYAPALIKVPLVKWHPGSKRVTAHIIAETPQTRIAGITGVFLHFKFFAGFHNKAKLTVSHGQHFNGSQEYIRYLRHVEATPDLSFMYEGSRRYSNSGSILAEGLIRSTEAFDQFARNQ